MQIIWPSKRIRLLFLLSVLLMFVHKVECYFTSEWQVAPAYLLIQHLNFSAGKKVFLTFIITLFFSLLWLITATCWKFGLIAFLAFWGLTFFLEIHHSVRSILSDGYYSGFYSSIIYILLGFFYWRELLQQCFSKSRRDTTV